MSEGWSPRIHHTGKDEGDAVTRKNTVTIQSLNNVINALSTDWQPVSTLKSKTSNPPVLYRYLKILMEKGLVERRVVDKGIKMGRRTSPFRVFYRLNKQSPYFHQLEAVRTLASIFVEDEKTV